MQTGFQHGCYDWVIAVTPIIISGAVALIGFLQYRINNYKFRLDLYNRRFTVYEKAIEYLQSYYAKDKKNVVSCAEEFIRLYRESVFLFGRDSEVYRKLEELQKTLSFLIQFDEKFSSQSYDKDEYKAHSNTKEKMRNPNKILEDLERALIPWLDFRKAGMRF